MPAVLPLSVPLSYALLNCDCFIQVDFVPLSVSDIHVWHPRFSLNGIKNVLDLV